MKKNVFVRFYHYEAHYYVIISSVPMIGHFELATRTLTSHALLLFDSPAARLLSSVVQVEEVCDRSRVVPQVVVVVIAQQLVSYRQLSRLRKSATAAGLSHRSYL